MHPTDDTDHRAFFNRNQAITTMAMPRALDAQIFVWGRLDSSTQLLAAAHLRVIAHIPASVERTPAFLMVGLDCPRPVRDVMFRLTNVGRRADHLNTMHNRPEPPR